MGDLCSGSFFPPTISSVFKSFQIHSTSTEGKHDRYNNIPTVIFHCVNILHLVYPLISWWAIEFSYLLDVLNNADVNTHLQLYAFNSSPGQRLCFPGGSSGKESTSQYRRHKRYEFIPGSGRSRGRGHGNPFQYSCLENHTDWGAWQVTVHRVAKSQTRLKWLRAHAHRHSLAWLTWRITKSWLQIFYF